MKQFNSRSLKYRRGLPVLLASLFFLSACGSSVTDSASGNTAAGTTSGSTTGTTGSGNPFTTTTGTTTATTTGSTTGTTGTTLPMPATAIFTIQGSTNAQIQGGKGNVAHFGPVTTPMSQKPKALALNTDNQLIVRVIAGTTNGLAATAYNFSPTYQCIDYTVSVNGYPYQTIVLSTVNNASPVMCPGAPSSQDLDFSNCGIANRGTGPVSITVTAAENDSRCNPYNLNYVYGLCGASPVSSLYWDYYANGSLQVQVNGTQLPAATNGGGTIQVCS